MAGYLRTYCERCTRVTDVLRDEDERHRCATCHEEFECLGTNEVFVSYATHNEDLARKFDAALRKRRFRTWFAPARITVGENFLTEIVQALSRVQVAVFLLTENSCTSPWVQREALEAVNRRKAIYPVRVRGTPLTPEWNFLLHQVQYSLVDEADPDATFDEVITEIIRQLKPVLIADRFAVQEPETATQRRGVDPTRRIYPGPRPFTHAMAKVFFGREKDHQRLIENLQARSLLVVAPSGAGKSSLLDAMLAPNLERNGYQVLREGRVGRALPEKYERQFNDIGNVFTFSVCYGLGDLPPPTNLNETFKQVLDKMPPRGDRQLQVVIIDQFEEIFTQHTHRFRDRVEFIRQVEEALRADPYLRVVFAMRQEYLADAEVLLAAMKPTVRPTTLRIDRLDEDALRNAIRTPAAAYTLYANDVVNEIIRQLKLTRVRLPDGTVSDVEAEHVELVHLQIVCASLWEKLPAGVSEVTLEHLREASTSMGNGDFGSFVRNAIENFYNRVVTDVADSEQTAQMGGYEPKLIKLGCMRFISRDGMRLTIQEGRRRTGRLPNAIVKQLADRYLLRITTVGTERWYELSHDLVAAAVARELDPKVSELMFAADRLEKELKRWRERTPVTGVNPATSTSAEAEPGRMFPQWFESRGDLLEACDPFCRQEGLDEEESEFVFRHALGSGRHVREWASRVLTDHAAVYENVIQDALACHDASVRLHAVRAIIHDNRTRDLSERLLEQLREVGIRETDQVVRREAAKHFVALNDNRIFESISNRASQDRMGLRFAAEMLAVSDVDENSKFDGVYATMSPPLRRRVRVRAWAIRFRFARKRLLYALLPTGAASMVFAGLYKAIPGAAGWALVQDSAGAGMGLFHGVTAGAIWGGLIPTAIALHQWVFYREKSDKSLLQPFAAIMFGALGGFVASCLVIAVILSVYSPTSLRTMGWVAQPQDARFSADFFHEAFVTTRMGWAHLWLGTCMGIGAALSLNLLRSRWPQFLADCKAPESLRDVRELSMSLVKVIGPRFWPVPVVLILGALAIHPVLRPGVTSLYEKDETVIKIEGPTEPRDFGPDGLRSWSGVSPLKLNVVKGLVGDVSTQIVGLMGTLFGLGLGMVVLRRGLVIPAETERT